MCKFLRMAALVSCLVAMSCGGGGGHSATEPPAIPALAGNWVGSWATAGVTFQTGMSLSQTGNSLSGTFSLLGSTLNITGTVGSNLQMTWSAVGGGCGSLTGDGVVNAVSATQITGNIDLNTIGCTGTGGGEHFSGPVVWTRGTAVATGKRGSVADLARLLRSSHP
jgi:hypothetical protein